MTRPRVILKSRTATPKGHQVYFPLLTSSCLHVFVPLELEVKNISGAAQRGRVRFARMSKGG